MANCIKINRPYRYDFFTIWGNGLQHAEEILSILRSEKDLEIIRIEFLKVKNMKKFVFDLYACDTFPIEHLRAKLKYLFKVRPEVLIIFVRNYNPLEKPAGAGAFRKVQCQYIIQIKTNIRNQFNPRHPDKDFQILPLGKGISHEHVIHASDYESQVDYFLKMFGHKNGIHYLHGDGDHLPFDKPYYLKLPKSYVYKTIPIEELRASILDDSGSNGVAHQIKKVSETPHYQSLKLGTDDYNRYLEKFRYTLLTADYSFDKLKSLDELATDKIRYSDRILVTAESNYYMILDGVHRAAVALNHGLDQMRCLEFIN